MSLFTSVLQQAYWRGIPFKVQVQEVGKGRKLALHDYPFRDGGWAEDLGRKLRTYRFSGYLIGDTAPVMQLALDAACELHGPGVLIHPTVGAVRVSLMSYTSSVRKEAVNIVDMQFEFVEQGSSLFPSIITDTIGAVLTAVSNAIPAFVTDIIGAAAAVAAVGLEVVSAGTGVVSSFGSQASAAAQDPAALVSIAAGLPPPDSTTSYGRYAAGNAVAALPPGTTVASLIAQLVTQRAATAAAVAAAQAAMAEFSAANAAAAVDAIAAMIEAARATMTGPADQIRQMAALAAFPTPATVGSVGLAGDIATMTDAVAATCRRCALASLANASAAYAPASYQDAATQRSLIAEAIGTEETAAGDAEEDASYLALRTLRANVVADLTARGASLPMVETVTMPSNLPSLVVAYRLYQDATRADEVANEATAIHPAFLPTTLQVLSS